LITFSVSSFLVFNFLNKTLLFNQWTQESFVRLNITKDIVKSFLFNEIRTREYEERQLNFMHQIFMLWYSSKLKCIPKIGWIYGRQCDDDVYRDHGGSWWIIQWQFTSEQFLIFSDSCVKYTDKFTEFIRFFENSPKI